MSESEQTPAASPSPEELRRAYKAFKKRLKLTQLDFDSRIGASPLSGHASQMVAITPPKEYPRGVGCAGRRRANSNGRARGSTVAVTCAAGTARSTGALTAYGYGSCTSTSQPVSRAGESVGIVDDPLDRAAAGACCR